MAKQKAETNKLNKYYVHWSGEMRGFQEIWARDEAEAEAEFDDCIVDTLLNNYHINQITHEFYPMIDGVERVDKKPRKSSAKRKKSKKKKR